MSETDVSLYVNDVAGLLGDQLAAVEAAIKIFMDDGARDKSSQYFTSHSSAQESSLSGMCELPASVPPSYTVKPNSSRAQDQAGGAFQNLSTVSTLLSAVTATAIQYTIANNGSRLARRTNMLWIISLSFSIAAAIHSQLAYYWIRHSHRTPSLKVSTFGSLLIKRAPLAFFVVYTIAFSGGLVAFAFLAFGTGSIPKVAVVCTSITIGSMVLVILWLASEKWELLLFKVKELGANVKEGSSRWITVISSLQARWRQRPVPARSHVSVSIPEDVESQSVGNAKGSLQSEVPVVTVSGAEPDVSRYEQSPFVPVDAAMGTVPSPA